ncbi:PQQ-like beta-propeller repeat protein [Dietzia sp. B32]|uniref:Rv3212 family protein n=1 Tax=Dietzia sp. B32 TaxID=2915130 RepID=UPI0021AE2196|nr:PQQ-like beta-propeller repeat protein [Dietzia sp. B32]UVE94822.1 PQQ-like beta-propeller repeat protein [Dietzia sp. B32]
MRADSHASGGRGRRVLGVPSERATRRDLVAAAVIVVVMAVVAATVLLSGSAARSQFGPADDEQPVYGPAVERPASLRPLWSHASEGTGAPLTTKGNLVTLDADGTLVGRDAGSGEQRWTYSHAGRFCAATFYADVLAAAFQGAAGCSDVTALDPTTQQYTSTRQSAFSDGMELTSTWRHALASGPDRLEIWRDDLVRTVEYGSVEAPQEADMQPRAGCTLGTADLTDDRFAVAERCPGDDSARLTLAETVPEDSRKPEEIASDTTGADDLWIIDVSDDGVLALTSRDGAWAVEWFTAPRQYSPVLRLDSEPAMKPGVPTLSADETQARWYDGASTHAFRTDTGQHSWTAGGTTGPGMTGGWSPDPEVRTARDWVLIPVAGGFGLLDHDTGFETLRLGATGTSGGGVTGLAQIGDILYERRAGQIHAYKLLT